MREWTGFKHILKAIANVVHVGFICLRYAMLCVLCVAVYCVPLYNNVQIYRMNTNRKFVEKFRRYSHTHIYIYLSQSQLAYLRASLRLTQNPVSWAQQRFRQNFIFVKTQWRRNRHKNHAICWLSTLRIHTMWTHLV